LLLIQDRRVAVSYMVQAVVMFDHYEFRDALAKASTTTKMLYLKTAPGKPGEKPWWDEYYSVSQKIRDREIFA
jgi:hypothetical protein